MGDFLVYGVREELPVHISQVESGKVCGCTCPHCHSALVAKKGKKTAHHFAHYNSDPCKFGFETSLHLAAKDVLERTMRIRLPAVLIKFNTHCDDIELSAPKYYEIDSIKLEKRLGNIIPDLILQIQGRPLLVEIFVTHKIDEEKKTKIRKLGISTIEIDLSRCSRNLNRLDLEETVVHEIENKRWILNVRVDLKHKDLIRKSKRKEIIFRKPGHPTTLYVDLCPLSKNIWKGRTYAHLYDDCFCCEHCKHFQYENEDEDGEETRQGYIFCDGDVRSDDAWVRRPSPERHLSATWRHLSAI